MAAHEALQPLFSDTAATVLCTVGSSAIAVISAWLTVRWTHRGDEDREIYNRIGKIIDISMQYPVVESEAMYANWPNPPSPLDDKSRYADYCCFIFNVMSGIHRHCRGDRTKVRRFLHVEELITRHYRWWENDPENERAYEKGFRDFVTSVISEFKARKQ